MSQLPVDGDSIFAGVLEDYNAHINPYLARLMSFAGFGVEMRAEGCYVYNQDGRVYLDCLGGYGVFSLGHRHPKIVEAVKSQLDHMGLSAKAFFSQPTATLARKLAEELPEGVDYTFFCNSGTEAVEAALKFAKAVTGRKKIVSTLGSYHGKTMGALSATGREKYRKRFEPLLPGVEFVPFGSLEAAEATIDSETACVIIEPIQGEGGIVVPPQGYLAGLRKLCDAKGALLIVDEVQTGLGRTGIMFACDAERVRPDMITLAKALGGGVMPIGSISGTPAIFNSIFSENPLAHTSTFGGNGLACAAGIATLDVIKSEGLVDRSNEMGARLKSGLEQVKVAQTDLIADVRGRGLMLGVEFAIDEVGELAVAQMLKRGMFVAYTLNNPRVLRFEPPLVINESQVDFAVETFGAAVSEVSEMLAMLV